MKFTIVYGTASPPGRLATAMAAFGACLEAAGATAVVVDLHASPVDWADGRKLDQTSKVTQEAVAALDSAQAVAVFTPIFRAAAPGVLKNLLDLTPLEALEGKAVAVVAMGGSDHHYLAADADLAPILTWFGAVAAPFRLYLGPKSFSEGALTAQAAGDIDAYARSFLEFSSRLAGIALAPRPLAAPRS